MARPRRVSVPIITFIATVLAVILSAAFANDLHLASEPLYASGPATPVWLLVAMAVTGAIATIAFFFSFAYRQLIWLSLLASVYFFVFLGGFALFQVPQEDRKSVV